jgi:uncharacterized membrane protein YbjE (DUF340 family)
MTAADVEIQAVAVATKAPSSYIDQEKKGAKCCGCCCDYRRAVIICNVLLLIFGIIGLVLYLGSAVSSRNVDVDDDEVIGIVDDAYTIIAALYGVSVVSAICGLVGGIKYNIPLVSIQVLWLIVAFVVGIVLSVVAINDVNDQLELNGEEELNQPIGSYIFSATITCLWMYPHVGFIMEVKSGIMSLETYPREEYSCCCVASSN